MQFDAIVLAADRGSNDPVAVAGGVAAKCLTLIAGSPMVVRVVRALEQSESVRRIVLCGPAAQALQGSPALNGLVAWYRPSGRLRETAIADAYAQLALGAVGARRPPTPNDGGVTAGSSGAMPADAGRGTGA
jgi:hypothetical protein